MTPADTSTVTPRPRMLRRLAVRGVTPLAIVVGVGVIGTGSAYAYWSGFGHGTGAAHTINDLNTLRTDATTPVGALLAPGDKAPLSLRITNAGPIPVTVTVVTPTATITSDKAGCAGSNVSAAAATGLTITIGAGLTVTTSIADLITMSNTAANACQGATFTIPVTLSGRNS